MPHGKVLSLSQSRHDWSLAAAERFPSRVHDVIRCFERPVFGAGVCACMMCLIAFAKPHTHPYVAPGAVEWEQIGSTNFMT